MKERALVFSPERQRASAWLSVAIGGLLAIAELANSELALRYPLFVELVAMLALSGMLWPWWQLARVRNYFAILLMGFAWAILTIPVKADSFVVLAKVFAGIVLVWHTHRCKEVMIDDLP